MLRKYTLKTLRELVRLGAAEDYTNAPEADVMALWRRGEKVGYSAGIYGINGGLIRNIDTGKLYAIIGRNANLFRIF